MTDICPTTKKFRFYLAKELSESGKQSNTI